MPEVLDHRQRATKAMQVLAEEAEKPSGQGVPVGTGANQRVISLAAQAITHGLLYVGERIDALIESDPEPEERGGSG